MDAAHRDAREPPSKMTGVITCSLAFQVNGASSGQSISKAERAVGARQFGGAIDRPRRFRSSSSSLYNSVLSRMPSVKPIRQVADPVLQDVVGGQPARVLVIFGLQELVGIGKGGIGAEVAAEATLPVTGHDRLEHVLLSVRRMDVARAQPTAFEVAETSSPSCETACPPTVTRYRLSPVHCRLKGRFAMSGRP